jgi:streptomycin 6-kinase
MENLPGISAAFISEIVRREVSSIQWVEELPGLWASVARRWGLEIAGPMRTGATSLVIPVVTRTGLRAAVKLVSPVVTIDAEVSALRAFAGRGAVTLLEAEDARQAMLLEWIDGPALSEMTDMGAAMAIAGRLTRELALADPPTGAPRLADQAGPWAAQLRGQHDAARRNGTAMSDEVLESALGIIRHLASDNTSTLTHGDLSLSNILRAEGDRWVAIDPVLLVGTPANEAHTVVRSHLTAAIRSDDQGARLTDWTRQFSEAAGADFALARALSFARFVASYYWESQNGGETIDVARLRKAALLLAPLV